MNTKKSILAVAVLFVLSNMLTTLWYMAMDDANYVAFRRDEINYAGLILNHLIFVMGFVYLFPFYIKSQNSYAKSVLFGAVVSAIMFLPTGLVVRSIWQVDFNLIFVLNTLVHITIGGVLGLVLRMIYNYKK